MSDAPVELPDEAAHFAGLAWLAEQYRRSENPLWVWSAIRWCANHDLIFPPWVREYLAASADALVGLKITDPKKAAQQIAGAVNLKAKSYSMQNDAARRSVACMMVEMAMGDDKSRTDIYDEVADYFGVEATTVRDWYNARQKDK